MERHILSLLRVSSSFRALLHGLATPFTQPETAMRRLQSFRSGICGCMREHTTAELFPMRCFDPIELGHHLPGTAFDSFRCSWLLV